MTPAPRRRPTDEELREYILAQPRQHQAEAFEEVKRRWPKTVEVKRISLRDHLLEVDPGPHRDWWHVGAMVEACQAVLDGEILRLAIHAPPRTFKSRTVVQGTSSCYVRNFPDETVALGMASDPVLKEQSGYAREMVRAAGVELKADSQNKSQWRTPQNGGMWARTVGAGLLGVGAQLMIGDDPFGSLREAMTRIAQDRVWNWMTRDFWQRAEPRLDGRPPAFIMMLQRLGRKDPAGKLYDALAEGFDPFGTEPWHVLELKGRHRERRTAYPKTCRVIKDPRKIGAPLLSGDPRADGIQAKIDERAAVDPDLSERLDQQEPPEEEGGGVFHGSFFGSIVGEGPTPRAAVEALASSGQIPRLKAWCLAFDLAAGGDDPVASILAASFQPGNDLKMIIADQSEAHPAAAAVEGYVIDMARKLGTEVEIALPSEIAIGRAFVATIKSKLQGFGFTVHLISEVGAKLAKARPYASTAAPRCDHCGALILPEDEAMVTSDVCKCEEPKGSRTGGVLLLRAPWNGRFRDVHQDFTGEEGGDDHIVDAGRICHAVLLPPQQATGSSWYL